MKKKNIKKILIGFVILCILGIPIWNRIFFLNVNITKDYKIKQVPFRFSYWLCDKDDYRVKGVMEWIIDGEYIHGDTNSYEYKYFVHNMKTKKTFYFSKEAYDEYLNFTNELQLWHGETMYDDIYNYIFNSHSHLYVSEQEAFRSLSIENKIEKIKKDCVGKFKIGFGPKFYDYLNIFQEENSDVAIPLLFDCLQNTEITPRESFSRCTEFDVYVNLLSLFYDDLTTEDKKKELIIYKEKLDKYLNKYKVIDSSVEDMHSFINNEWDPSLESLLKKYTDMGYKDLKIKNSYE